MGRFTKVESVAQFLAVEEEGYTHPNRVGDWDFRSFTFAPDQIVVNQGDKVTLHFVGVQGVHHVITAD